MCYILLRRGRRIAVGRSLLKPCAKQHMSPSQSAHVNVQHPLPKKKFSGCTLQSFILFSNKKFHSGNFRWMLEDSLLIARNLFVIKVNS